MIEILWKQDIDIGVPRDHFRFPGEESNDVEDVEIATSKDKLDLKVYIFFLSKGMYGLRHMLRHKELLGVTKGKKKVLVVEPSSSNDQQ